MAQHYEIQLLTLFYSGLTGFGFHIQLKFPSLTIAYLVRVVMFGPLRRAPVGNNQYFGSELQGIF